MPEAALVVNTARQRMTGWRGLLLGYLFLALYRYAALQVPHMNALALVAARSHCPCR